MFFLFNKELIFLIMFRDEVHEYISLIFFRIFSDFLLGEQSLYLDLLRKEIHQKSIQNLRHPGLISALASPMVRRRYADGTRIYFSRETTSSFWTLITANRPYNYSSISILSITSKDSKCTKKLSVISVRSVVVYFRTRIAQIYTNVFKCPAEIKEII